MKRMKFDLTELNLETFETSFTFTDDTSQAKNARALDDSFTYPECGTGFNDTCAAGTCNGAGLTCDTTCHQVICGCSAYPTDCDATCANYWNALAQTCTGELYPTLCAACP